MAKSRAACRPAWNGAADQAGEEAATGEHVPAGPAGRWARVWAPIRCCDRVVAEEGGEQGRDRRQMGDPVGHGRRHAVGDQPVVAGCAGSDDDQADDHQGEEDPDREHLGRVLEGGVHPRTRAPVLRRQAVHHPGPVGRAERGHGQPGEEQQDGRRPSRGSRRAGARAGRSRPRCRACRRWRRAGPRSGPTGCPTTGPAMRNPSGEREHGDPGPQRGAREVVAVQRAARSPAAR